MLETIFRWQSENTSLGCPYWIFFTAVQWLALVGMIILYFRARKYWREGKKYYEDGVERWDALNNWANNVLKLHGEEENRDQSSS